MVNTPDPVRAVLKGTRAARLAQVSFRTALTGSGVFSGITPDPVRAVLKGTRAARLAQVSFRTALTGSGVFSGIAGVFQDGPNGVRGI